METYSSNLYNLCALLPSFSSSSIPSALNRLSEWMAAAILAALVVWRHDAGGLWGATGSLVNVVFSIALKKVINQPRPFPPKRSDPGMPSAHTQIIFYTLTFLVLSMVEVLGLNQISLILGGIALSFAAFLSRLRVSEKYHTVSQVLVGALVGTTFTLVWMWAWTVVVFEAFQSSQCVRVLVSAGATAFWLVFFLVTRSKMFTSDVKVAVASSINL